MKKSSGKISFQKQATEFFPVLRRKTTWRMLMGKLENFWKKWSKQIRKLHWSIEFCNHSWMSCEPENGLKRFWEPFENKFIGRLIKIRKSEVLLQYLKYWFGKYIFIFRFLSECVFSSRNSSRSNSIICGIIFILIGSTKESFSQQFFG